MAERARVILNPAAGRDEAAGHVRSISELLHGRFGQIETVLTGAAGDAEVAARRAVEDGCTHVFVGGGDGTLNEVLNGVAAVDGALARVTFGLLPLGTGNDFAQAIGIPVGVEPALAVLLEDRRVAVDVGVVNDRLFVNVSAGGFIADVSEAVTPQLKSIAGRLAYLVGGAQALLDFEPVGLRLRGEPDGAAVETEAYAFAVCNSRLIGGGRLIAPHALIDDGLLDVCVIGAMSTVEFVGLLREVSDGGHVDDPRVHYLRIREASIRLARPVNVNTDGEVLETAECAYRVLPGAASFLAGATPFADAVAEKA
jgi:diacylglycerol kinase (ATP)